MKETKKSLQWFLVIVGTFGIYSSLAGLKGGFPAQPLLGTSLIISGIFSLITLYIGIRFSTFIQTASKYLIKFFWVNIVWVVIVGIYLYLAESVNAGIFIFYGIDIVIFLIIIKNVGRLAKNNRIESLNTSSPPSV